MKIRIQGNSIRLRLSQSEVVTFSGRKLVQDSTQFGPTPEETLIYSLEMAAIKEPGAAYSPNHIKVFVPENIAQAWANSDEVSIIYDSPLGNGAMLKILVEKDFQCRTTRPGEDESDNFPNPLGGHD